MGQALLRLSLFFAQKARLAAAFHFFLLLQGAAFFFIIMGRFMQKNTGKKSSRKSAPRKRKARKAKVPLDRKKLMVLCAIVCASCVLLLALTAIFSGEGEKKTGSSIVAEKVLDEENDSAKNSVEKKDKKSKKRKAASQKEEKKAEEKKDVEEKIAETPKEEEKPAPKIEEARAEEPAKESAAEKKEEKISEQEKAQVPAGFAFPYAQKNAVLCVVFDDGGQNISQLQKCVALPFPVTVAVLPRLPHSAEAARIVRQSGNEVILHQPMQAMNLKVNPGEGAIKPGMSSGELAATLSQNIAEISPIAGMNNHEGSLITEDESMVAFILQIVQDKGIYFLDSRTSSATKVPSVAMQMGMGYYQRDIFLDNQKTRENYLSELKKGLDIANKKGHVIMIGHVWSAASLPAFLEEVYPELALKGYRFATVSKSGGMIQ